MCVVVVVVVQWLMVIVILLVLIKYTVWFATPLSDYCRSEKDFEKLPKCCLSLTQTCHCMMHRIPWDWLMLINHSTGKFHVWIKLSVRILWIFVSTARSQFSASKKQNAQHQIKCPIAFVKSKAMRASMLTLLIACLLLKSSQQTLLQ